MAISTGQGYQTGLFDGTILAFLGTNITFTAVVHIGDTIRTVTEVTELRKTKKPGTAIMKTMSTVYNQDDVAVLTHEDTLMILCRNTEA
jgi:acyl dehydratase